MTRDTFIEGSPGADTTAFIETIYSADNFFSRAVPIIITRAPGRLDVMGGIADYSGSLVLQLPIADATHVALQRLESTQLRILSLGTNAENRSFEMDLTELCPNDQPIDYINARQQFADQDRHWVSYVVGVFVVLMREVHFRPTGGAAVLIKSTVPEGKGVSSSAALEVAVMQAVTEAFNIEIDCGELARLCQKVENLVAGAPCGIMDQMTSSCGEENRLLRLLCQPDILEGTLPLPDELQVWGIDSGVRHSVSGSDYGTVRTAAFIGYRMIAAKAGLNAWPTELCGKLEIADHRWGGYLANITPEEFEQDYSHFLPETITGDEFLDRYQGTNDSVTNVQPDREYPVFKATRHPIYENARVHSFASIIENWNGIGQARDLGEFMFQSHQSYSDCGLGSDATDLIVTLVKDSMDQGLFGARITGGGSGGTVAVLGRREATPVIENLRKRFRERTGYNPLVICGSSPGAGIFGHLKLLQNAVR